MEGIGEQVNRMLLGDLDEDARAAIATRRQLAGDSDVARIAGQQGRVNSQIRSIADDIRKLHKRDEIGATLFREEFPANNVIDMLILRGRDAFLAAWTGNGGPDNVERFRDTYGEVINKARGEGYR